MQTQSQLPTPVRPGKLEKFLQGYEPALTQYLVAGFSEGFSVQFQGARSFAMTNNHRSASLRPNIVANKLDKERTLGRIAGPFHKPPFPNIHVSPLGLVPKKGTDEFRLIHDLSFSKSGNSINSGIPKEFTTVQYATLDAVVHAVLALGRGALIAKADIEAAFRIIPIAPADYELLGFCWNGQYYHDRCLPFGCSASCKIFEAFSTAIQWILTAKFGVEHMSHIIDDFMFVGPPQSDKCGLYLSSFMKLAAELGIPVKQEKTVLPSTCVIVHGIEIDTLTLEAKLPADKLAKIKNLLNQFQRRRKATLRELQSLIGTLNFACLAVIPGRAFLRRLINKTKGVSQPHFHIRLDREARADLHAWSLFIAHFNGRAMLLPELWLSSSTLHLYSDASGTLGFAAVFGNKWFSGVWPAMWKTEQDTFHINLKEFLPVVLAIEIWGPYLANKCILFLCDNQTTVHVINKLSSRDSLTMQLVRRLAVAIMRHNIFLRSKHIAGKTNVIADRLSRLQMDEARKLAPWLDALATPVPQELLPWVVPGI